MVAISLDGYLCCLISFSAENSATLKLRAYKKDNSSGWFDISFFSTTYIQLPALFEESSLEIVPTEEMSQLLDNLPQGFRRGVSVFRFGPINSGKYVVSHSYSLEASSADEVWIPPDNKTKKYDWAKNNNTIEKISEMSFFYLNSMHRTSDMLYLSFIATDSSDKKYHIYCQDVHYIQMLVFSDCLPFQVADKSVANRFVNNIGLVTQDDSSLLTTLAQNTTVYIFCANFTISSLN